MRLLVQLVSKAKVEIEGVTKGEINKGYLVLLGACEEDTEEIADKMLKKLINLRIFADENGKTNLSINDVSGELLIVSQFTLYADCRKGNRPSFIKAGNPAHAESIYEYFVKKAGEDYGIHVETGEFGADMQVTLTNDGPFTVMLDSEEIVK